MAVLLVAVNKGWFDGYYMDDETGYAAWHSLATQYPDEGWVATKVLSNTVYLPQHTFHTYARDAEENNK